jgi:hypothetical protein
LIEDCCIGEGGESCALLWFVYHLHHSVISYPRLQWVNATDRLRGIAVRVVLNALSAFDGDG